jgi:hypothetical protein
MILSLFIVILSLIYAFGDFYGWWDYCRGRKSIMEGLERLESPENFPEIIIFDDELEFDDLFKFVLNKTKSQKVRDYYRVGRLPTAIVRVGGTLKPDVGEELPAGWPNPKFAPLSSPVAFVYEYRNIQNSFENSLVEPVGNLGDIHKWLNDSKNRERFIVAALLIGLLSIASVVLDLTKNKK